MHLVSRVSFPVGELIFNYLVLNWPKPVQHDPSVELRLCLQLTWLGWNCMKHTVNLTTYICTWALRVLTHLSSFKLLDAINTHTLLYILIHPHTLT